jgi:hypothetical protein
MTDDRAPTTADARAIAARYEVAFETCERLRRACLTDPSREPEWRAARDALSAVAQEWTAYEGARYPQGLDTWGT